MSRKKNKTAYSEEAFRHETFDPANLGLSYLGLPDEIPMDVRQAYLQGCIIAARKNGNLDEIKGSIEKIGSSLGMEADEITESCKIVSELTETEEQEFVDEMLSIIKKANLSFHFLFDVESLVGENEKASQEGYKFIYRSCINKLVEEKDTWRVQVYDLLSEADKQRRWIKCCTNASEVNLRDAQYALACFCEKGIISGNAESLFRKSAENGNRAAKVELTRCDRIKEERTRQRNEKILQAISKYGGQLCDGFNQLLKQMNEEEHGCGCAFLIIFVIVCSLIGC